MCGLRGSSLLVALFLNLGQPGLFVARHGRLPVFSQSFSDFPLRPLCEVFYLIARGFTGDATAPVTGKAGATNRNS